jgi:hypothetical protein
VTELAGTVATYGPDGGSVVLDDGRRLPYALAAVTGVRLLHPGQRVRLRLGDGSGEVRALTLVSLPLPG